MSFFTSVARLPEDPIFKLPAAYHNDPRAQKVNLGVGSYHDPNGCIPIFSSVRKAEQILLGKESSKDYLPIAGLPAFIEAVNALIFGIGGPFLQSPGTFTVQTLGGTGALRLGGDFLARATGKRGIYLPQPTWPNHRMVFSYAGLEVRHYNYFDKNAQDIDFKGICQAIAGLSPDSIVLLHVCCHNPTGYGLSHDQWQELSVQLKRQRAIPFFDLAYQGFGEGIEEDVFPVRLFAEQGHEMLVATSLSKNFGMYSERVGSLSIVAHDGEAASRIGSQLKQMIRSNYSNPPRHGAQIAAHILQSAELKSEWMEELSGMRSRLIELRRCFIAGLQAKGGKDWSFLARQQGFFAYCGLIPAEANRLVKDYGIYVPDDGRINLTGLNEKNLEYVIEAIHSVVHL